MKFCRNITDPFTAMTSVLGDFISVLRELWVWSPAEDPLLCWNPLCAKAAHARPSGCSVPRVPGTAIPLHLQMQRQRMLTSSYLDSGKVDQSEYSCASSFLWLPLDE